MTTVDRRGRPRARLVHPVWEEPTGWLATYRHSFKEKHLAANPWISLAFWDQEQEQVYADCRATWIDDTATKDRLWDLYTTAPEGYELPPFLEEQSGPQLRAAPPRP